MAKKLIATDFDGTLYKKGKISKADRAEIERWQKDGRYFGVVTGRGEDFINTVHEKGLSPDYLIVYNGSKIFDKNSAMISEKIIPADIFKKIELFFEKVPDKEYYSLTSDETTFNHYYATMPDTGRALEVAAEINKLYGENITAFVNGKHINIGIKGSGKSESVFEIAEYFGLSDSEVATVGDDYNDMQMLVEHDGWAMQSGKKEVKAACNHTCRSIACLIRELMAEE